MNKANRGFFWLSGGVVLLARKVQVLLHGDVMIKILYPE